MANLTSVTNAVWIPEIIANETLGALGNYLNLGRTVAMDSELTDQKEGDVINVTKRGTVTANQKAANTDITLNVATGTQVPVTLNQHWEVSIAEEDFTNALQRGETLPGYLQDSVIALAEKIEGVLVDLIPSFTAQVAWNTDALTTLRDAREQMVTNKVPKMETKYGYFHQSFISALLAADAFVDPKVLPNNRPLTEGAVGRAYGIDIFESQMVESNGGTPAYYQNLVYTRNSICLATRPLKQPDAALGVQAAVVRDDNGIALRVMRSFDHKQMATIQSLDVLFGAAIIDDRRATEVLSEV